MGGCAMQTPLLDEYWSGEDGSWGVAVRVLRVDPIPWFGII